MIVPARIVLDNRRIFNLSFRVRPRPDGHGARTPVQLGVTARGGEFPSADACPGKAKLPPLGPGIEHLRRAPLLRGRMQTRR